MEAVEAVGAVGAVGAGATGAGVAGAVGVAIREAWGTLCPSSAVPVLRQRTGRVAARASRPVGARRAQVQRALRAVGGRQPTNRRAGSVDGATVRHDSVDVGIQLTQHAHVRRRRVRVARVHEAVNVQQRERLAAVQQEDVPPGGTCVRVGRPLPLQLAPEEPVHVVAIGEPVDACCLEGIAHHVAQDVRVHLDLVAPREAPCR